MAAGLFLVALGGAIVYASWHLGMGRGAQLGPGSFPKSLGFLLMANGVLLGIISMMSDGPALERWNPRGILFVLGAVVMFSVLIRPAGLVVAGPLALLFSGFATPDTDVKENAIFAVVMTAFCILLFKVALGLPIPVAPWAGW